MKTIGFIIGVLVLASCANPVSPTGGPKDTTAPQLLQIKKEPLLIKDSALVRWVFVFDENIQVKGAALVNPSNEYQEQRGTVNRNELVFEVPLNTQNFSYGKTISDLNEGNLYQSNDSDQIIIQLQFKNPKAYRNAKGQWIATIETEGDRHWVLPSQNNNEGYTFAYPDPAPFNSKSITVFLDANANHQFDSTEVFAKGSLSAEEKKISLFEYPALLSTVSRDSSFSEPKDSSQGTLIIKGNNNQAYYFEPSDLWVEQNRGALNDSIQMLLQEGKHILYVFEDYNQNLNLDWPEPYTLYEVVIRFGLENELSVKKIENDVDFDSLLKP